MESIVFVARTYIVYIINQYKGGRPDKSQTFKNRYAIISSYWLYNITFPAFGITASLTFYNVISA